MIFQYGNFLFHLLASIFEKNYQKYRLFLKNSHILLKKILDPCTIIALNLDFKEFFMAKENKWICKKSNLTLVIGGVLFALAIIYMNIAGAIGAIPFSTSYPWGIIPGTGWFWTSFSADPGWTGTGRLFWGNLAWYRCLAVAICYLSIFVTIIGLVFVVLRKKFKSLINLLAALFVTFFASYVFVSFMLPLDRGVIWRSAAFNYTIVFSLSLLSMFFLSVSSYLSLRNEVETFSEKEARQAAREEYLNMKATEGKTYTENEIRAIVREEMTSEKEKIYTEPEIREIVVDELSKHQSVETIKEVEEDKTEEKPAEVETETVADEESNDPFANLGSKRRASFETKLKNSEYDLRHKYYDLRDYVKSYGIKNRISIPGDTFSAKREKLVFITISGKKLKVSFALDPKEYEQTPIPVETNTSKKMAEMPLCFRVKSDLSFRRACKLVDDLMAKKGYKKLESNKK